MLFWKHLDKQKALQDSESSFKEPQKALWRVSTPLQTFQDFFGCKYLAVCKRKTTLSPKQSKLLRKDARCVWKSRRAVVTDFDAPIVTKPTRLINDRGNFQLSHENAPIWKRLRFFFAPALTWFYSCNKCMSASAGRHVSVCHFKDSCFITKHKNVSVSAYLHAEDVKVKTKAFMSWGSDSDWQLLLRPRSCEKHKRSHMWSSAGLIRTLTCSIINHHSGEITSSRKTCSVGKSVKLRFTNTTLQSELFSALFRFLALFSPTRPDRPLKL